MASRVLTINTGSSSLRSAGYDLDAITVPLVSTGISRIGFKPSRMRISDSTCALMLDGEASLAGHVAALRRGFVWLPTSGRCMSPARRGWSPGAVAISQRPGSAGACRREWRRS